MLLGPSVSLSVSPQSGPVRHLTLPARELVRDFAAEASPLDLHGVSPHVIWIYKGSDSRASPVAGWAGPLGYSGARMTCSRAAATTAKMAYRGAGPVMPQCYRGAGPAIPRSEE